MQMARVEGEDSRPALMCVCSERQWLLWRTCLENREIVELVNEHFLFWVQSSCGTAGKEALTALKDESDTAGTMAIVCSVGGKERILHKISGPPTVAELKRALQETLTAFQERRRNWLRLQEERELRRQQDLEYEESLQNDREKEKRQKNTKACQTDHEPLPEAEAGAQAEEGTNPPPTKRLRSDELTRVIVISPDGRRHQLDISRESTLMELHQQVRNFLPEGSTTISLSYQVDGTIWRLIPNHETMTVAQFGLEPNCVLRSSYSENSRETDA